VKTTVNREQVVDAILRNIAENLDDLDPGEIDPSLSMEDYGANSLDVIEIVSCTMRELRIKVPRSELARIDTIDGFADALLEHAP
jgi:acyl carrier protein/polyketide biosynthesis acyl carrier protein